jgi:hypothetical protein
MDGFIRYESVKPTEIYRASAKDSRWPPRRVVYLMTRKGEGTK